MSPPTQADLTAYLEDVRDQIAANPDGQRLLAKLIDSWQARANALLTWAAGRASEHNRPTPLDSWQLDSLLLELRSLQQQQPTAASGWVITNADGEHWSNANGWTSGDDYDTFTDADRKWMTAPIGGTWKPGAWTVKQEPTP